MKPADYVATHALFTRAEFATAMGDRGPRSPATVTSHIKRWLREGRVRAVKPGLFVRGGGTGTAERVGIDFLALASRMASDATLAYHSALEVHGAAQSVFERFTFATWTRVKPVRFEGRQFVPVRPRAPLARARDPQAWTELVERAGLEVRVTSLERTVVDVFDRPALAGGIEEVWRSCMSVPFLDLRALETYLTLLGGRTLMARVGYYLERRSEALAVPPRLLERLRAAAPRVPVYMERRRRGRLVAAWNLVVPPEVLASSKEAGDADTP